jgi:predicted Zn-dependent protease
VVLAIAAASAVRADSFQTGGPAPAGSQPVAAKQTCVVDLEKPSGGDTALLARRYAEAGQFYGAALSVNPSSTKAMAGQARTLLGENKLAEALALAIEYDHEHPNDPNLLDALGEVRFRRGEVGEAATAFNQSSHLDPCIGLTHYDASRYLNLSGTYGSAQRQLDLAHTLSPENEEIARVGRSSHAVGLTPEQRLARLKQRLGSATLTDEERNGTQEGDQRD